MPRDRGLPNDEELIERLLKKDEQAYTQIVRAYFGTMQTMAAAIVGNAFADEVVQDAWIAVVRALPQFEKRSSLKTWILRIVSNTAKSRLRRESRSIAMGDLLEDNYSGTDSGRYDERGHWRPDQVPRPWHHDSPDSILSSEELRHQIEQTLESLPPLQRVAITLRDMEGLDMEEICKILEVSESNARVLLHRGRTKIRLVIEKHEST